MNRTEPCGVWLLNEATDELTYVETHRGSTIASAWPVGDSETLYTIQRGCDWLLNAAGAGVESLTTALRARWPGDKRGLPTPQPKQSEYWTRVLYGMRGGATRRLFMGDLDPAGRLGFVVDDSKDGDTVTGWAGGTASSSFVTRVGAGPGRGFSGTSSAGAGGGSAATAGSVGNGGTQAGPPSLAVAAEYVLRAVIDNDYTQLKMLASGGGGAPGTSTGGDGGASGGGLVRVSLTALTESTSRTLTGVAGAQSSPTSSGSGGGGGGGVYLAICGGSYTQSAGTINVSGGAGGPNPQNVAGRGGAGGDGHIIIMAADGFTFSGTRTGHQTTMWRIISAPPPGGSLISS